MTGRGILDRRAFLALGAAAATAPLVGRAFAGVPADTPLHGLSAFGDLKYGPDFKHFSYLNPDAPKGGTFNFQPPNWGYNQSTLTFNTLNFLVPRGDSPPRIELTMDSLMVRALDEPDAIYGLLAEKVVVSADSNSFTFLMRPEARFHDGSSLTAEDVAFSFALYREKGHPSLQLPLFKMKEAVAEDARTFRITFDGTQSARTILGVAEFPIVSKAYFTANPFDGTSMKPILGSGPYQVGRVQPGQVIEYHRVEDYWARDLPVNRGLNNFDRIRIEFYRERQAAFEAFKKGDVHFRQEFTSRTWATGYDFPAIAQGKVIRREFPGELRPSMQAQAINLRRERFRDVRVRQAIAMCFDFEWTRRNLFYDSYERSQSLFERSPFRAEGLPSPEELALLEPLRGQIPAEAFGEAVVQPVSDGSGRDRKLLREASRLLAEAGWKRDGGMLKNELGQALTLEILVQDEVFVRVDSPWMENMRAIGIDASIRMVDSAQYQARQADFDFDVIAMAASFTASPTREEVERMFHSRAATLAGSRNLPGTADPGVDALVEAVGRASNRDELTTAMRALDRVLRARRDWIPNWFAANHRAAYWDMFGFVEPKPDYGFPVEQMWWFEQERARAIGKA